MPNRCELREESFYRALSRDFGKTVMTFRRMILSVVVGSLAWISPAELNEASSENRSQDALYK